MIGNIAVTAPWLRVGGLTFACALLSLFAAEPGARAVAVSHAVAVSPQIVQQATPRAKGLVAVIETSLGTIDCELDPADAPNTVANFVWLARCMVSAGPRTGVPFYDGLTFHRVIPGFIIQGGDPNGNGTGGPGFEVADEISSALTFDGPGVLAMANRGKNTNGSQFFITDAAAPHMNGTSTIFGHCDHPEVVHRIASVPRASNDRPIEPVTIVHVRIE